MSPAMPATRSLYLHAGLLVVQLAGVMAIGWSTPFNSGFPLDDAWIHQTAARNLIEHGTLGMIPGHFGSGTTSVLWVVLLAINHAVLHWPPSLYAAILGTSLLIIAGQSVFYCARRDGWESARAWIFAALFSIGPNHAWFALSGMEVCLGTALLVLAILLWFSRPESPITAFSCGALLALLILTRIESLLPCVLLFVLALRAHCKPTRLAWAALLPSIALVGYLGANITATGHAAPSTLMGRRWMWFQEAADWSWYEPRIQLVAHWLDRLWQFTLAEPWLPLYWFLVGLSLIGLFNTCRQMGRMGVLVLVAIAQFGTYLILLPIEGHGGRYQPLVAALFLPLICEGSRTILLFVARTQPGLRRLAPIVPWLLPLALLPSLIACLGKWSEAQELSVMHVNSTEVRAGRWAAALPHGARIASFDVGGISYFGNRRILDLGGLSDPSTLSDIRLGRVRERLEAERVEYLVVPMGYSDDFPDPLCFTWRLGLLGRERPKMDQILEFASHPALWAPGFIATLNCAPRQVVFHLTRDRQVQQ